MLADKDTVAKLIPQEFPMVMVHGLIEHDDRKTVTTFTVEEGNIFIENGYLSEAGLVENMAQSSALRTGWISAATARDINDFTPSVGVIGAIKNFVLFLQPEAGSRLHTTIELLTEFGNATMVKAFIRENEEILASAELKIFLTQEQEADKK